MSGMIRYNSEAEGHWFDSSQARHFSDDGRRFHKEASFNWGAI